MEFPPQKKITNDMEKSLKFVGNNNNNKQFLFSLKILLIGSIKVVEISRKVVGAAVEKFEVLSVEMSGNPRCILEGVFRSCEAGLRRSQNLFFRVVASLTFVLSLTPSDCAPPPPPTQRLPSECVLRAHRCGSNPVYHAP